MQLKWVYKKFDELEARELYAIMQLRNEVFVVEQNCIYQDADGKDSSSMHLAGWDRNKLMTYCRIIPPGISYPECSIGRVVCSPAYRKTGAGRALMTLAIEKAFQDFSVISIKIGAQLYLKEFYASLNFIQSGDQYLEDGIPHIEMQLKK